ncbi:hypothetical protein Pst134EB_018360 [Puccinia striiformis f. sp. tritici]|nr:hypothetical protein Pst134EB_018360 [Puccinia striiformis f. sp. tritici]
MDTTHMDHSLRPEAETLAIKALNSPPTRHPHPHLLRHQYKMPRQTERGSTIARMQHIIHQHVQGAMIGSALNDNSDDSSKDSDLEEALVALIMI